MEKCVLTIATGKRIYIEMAATLARSYRATNRVTQIPFVIATDRPDLVPRDLRNLVIVKLDPDVHGSGFETKLWMDQLSPATQTLYVDADCLIAGDISDVFSVFRGRGVSAVGKSVSEGEWFGSIQDRCARLKLPSIPLFVGAIYYFDQSLGAHEIFQSARTLAASYDELGLVRLRMKKNEEPLVSIAMAMFGQSPVADDGTIKADAMHFPNLHSVDVLRGHARFVNSSGFRSETSPKGEEVFPLIAHFNDTFASGETYQRESFILRLTQAGHCPITFARILAWLRVSAPYRVRAASKELFRPLYHALFGFQRIKNPRV